MINQEDPPHHCATHPETRERDARREKVYAPFMYFFTDGNFAFVARQMDIDRKRVKVLVDAGIA